MLHSGKVGAQDRMTVTVQAHYSLTEEMQALVAILYRPSGQPVGNVRPWVRLRVRQRDTRWPGAKNGKM